MRTHVRKNSIIALWNLVVQDVSGNGMHVFETRLHLSPWISNCVPPESAYSSPFNLAPHDPLLLSSFETIRI
jgi:hypothetical protein